MIHSLSAINWAAVAVAFVAYAFLGGLWFTLFFKKPYLASLGRENEPPQKPAPIFMIGPAVCSFVITLTSALLMHALGIGTYAGAAEFAGIVGIGYLVANTVNIAINPNIPRPLFYGLISGLFHLTGIFMVCMIIAAMG